MPSQRRRPHIVGPLAQQPGETDARYWLRLKQIGAELFDRIESDRLDPEDTNTQENPDVQREG